MNKYIDADKLIALIDTKLEDLGMSGSVWVGRSVLQELKNDIVTSLQQEQPEADLEKVWDWIDETFTETEIEDLRYGESRNVVMSYDVCKSDLREKYERDFGINARKEE